MIVENYFICFPPAVVFCILFYTLGCVSFSPTMYCMVCGSLWCRALNCMLHSPKIAIRTIHRDQLLSASPLNTLNHDKLNQHSLALSSLASKKEQLAKPRSSNLCISKQIHGQQIHGQRNNATTCLHKLAPPPVLDEYHRPRCSPRWTSTAEQYPNRSLRHHPNRKATPPTIVPRETFPATTATTTPAATIRHLPLPRETNEQRH